MSEMRQNDSQHKAQVGEMEAAPVVMEAAAPKVEAAAWQLEPRPTRPTINDVARRCGLSKATISKALNLSEAESPVNAQTRRMVLQVAEEMGYRPNFRARSLTHGRSNAIGLLHDRPAPHINGVYDGMIYAFAQTLLESGFHLTLVPTVGDSKDWCHPF